MGKPSGKKKKPAAAGAAKQGNGGGGDSCSKTKSGGLPVDEDGEIFHDMAQDFKDEGNRLFQRRDYEGALLNYEKALNLLPQDHRDIAYLRSNLAACYMHMVPPDYYRAINECNFALEVAPKYSKALIKRARCFEALGRFDLAWKDAEKVVGFEPNNLTGLEILERVRKMMNERGLSLSKLVSSPSENLNTAEKKSKKKASKNELTGQALLAEEEGRMDRGEKEQPTKAIKLVFGEDIRVAQVPLNCSIGKLREVVRTKFPKLKAILIKYKDKEGDMVTLTTGEELTWAVESADLQGPVRLYITEVDPEHDPVFDGAEVGSSSAQGQGGNQNSLTANGNIRRDVDRGSMLYVDDWIVQFAQLFKNHCGISSDGYMDFHDLSMKLHSEALEDTVTCEEAQKVFDLAESKFQEMAALAMFNWGNIYMSRARKKLSTPETSSKDLLLEQVKSAYEYARGEYIKAGSRYEESLKIKTDFYEGFLALAQQQFEQAKLAWYYAIGCDEEPSSKVLDCFNSAEDNIERGIELWEEFEEERLKDLRKPNKEEVVLNKLGLKDYVKDASRDEAAEQASNMRAQINILWGTMLYERSVVEFKLGLPLWEDCLTAAVDKFNLAGASPTDIAVMIKNHCANETAQEGLGFKVDEIVQAWNEMYDAKRWLRGIPSFRLEPILRRGVSKLHTALEHI